MNAVFHPTAQVPLQLLQRPRKVMATPQRPAVVAPVPRSGWLEQLAAWAERQPQHRRMGSFGSRQR